jgi:hypothetical protein
VIVDCIPDLIVNEAGASESVKFPGAAGLYFQRSFRIPVLPTESTPTPPNNQKAPVSSTQAFAVSLPPGAFVAEGVPNVPYCPAWPPPWARSVLFPPTHVQATETGSKTQRSSRSPNV